MSDYLRSLCKVAKFRYLEKLSLLGLKEHDDPYAENNRARFVDDMSCWPNIEYGNIFVYFVERPGVYTQRQMVQWKSLDAYNYFMNGHVRQVRVFRVDSTRYVLSAKVNPSQSSPDNAHHPWVAAKVDGEIITAHCTCMAGLGEGCSHIAALLFKVESAVRNGYTTCTSNLCQWNQVFSTKHQPARVIDTDFSRPLHQCDNVTRNVEEMKNRKRSAEQPSDAEQLAFLEGVKKICPTAAVLTATFLQPKPTRPPIPQLPTTIPSLFHPKYKDMTPTQLSVECKQVFESMTMDRGEADFLARSTSLQANSLIWHQHRIGRLTASKFRSICCTSMDSPSESLVSGILTHKHVTSAPLAWGRNNEAPARKEYERRMRLTHQNFSLQITGLHVHPSYPHVGASPDGLISCDCCGEGVLEVKCPYSIRNQSPDTVTSRNFFMYHDENGMHLDKTHAYYYQVQGQLGVCERDYCDFVCWTPKGTIVERIVRDKKFFDSIMEKLTEFFIKVILPRILTGKYTVEKDHLQSVTQETDKFCYCQKGEFGQMVACDNPACKIEWFHFKCVGLTREPKGTWYCLDCRCTLRH